VGEKSLEGAAAAARRRPVGLHSPDGFAKRCSVMIRYVHLTKFPLGGRCENALIAALLEIDSELAGS
jgi:hypothetical protein